MHPLPAFRFFLLAAVSFAVLGACSSENDAGPGGGQSVPADNAQTPANGASTSISTSTSTSTSTRASPRTYALKNLLAMNIRGAKLQLLLQDLKHPWAMEFLDVQTLIVTELNGRLLRYRLGAEAAEPIEGAPEVATGYRQTGLLDVEVHPEFDRNRRLYFSHTVHAEAGEGYYHLAVSTAVLEGDRLVDEQRLVTVEPPGWSTSNFGGALEFDDSGHLFISVGERAEHELAQRGDRLQGKVLRLRDDGSVPADNPFIADPNIDDRIFALGVRNPQGLHYDGVTGVLYETEHGPLGGDEINRIEAGANHGWPAISYGINYLGSRIASGTHAEGMAQPLFYFTPSIAISPIAVYRGEQFPEWEGDLLIGALKGKSLFRLDLDGDRVRAIYPFLGELNARIRDVKVGADGAIYVLTQFGMLFRLSREIPEEIIPPEPSGAELYTLVCAGCHDTGAAGAPMLSERTRWAEIARQSRADIERHTLLGIGEMPERGLCDLCSDEQLLSIVDYMLAQSTGEPSTEAEPAGEP